MKLSDAILAGCKLSKPIKAKLFYKKGDTYCCCVIGAALMGAGINTAEKIEAITRSYDTYVDLLKANGVDKVFKAFNAYHTSKKYTITAANDNYDISREQIAEDLANLGY